VIVSAKYLGSWFVLLLFLTSCRDFAPGDTLHLQVSPTAVTGVLATVGRLEVVTPRAVKPTITQTTLSPTRLPATIEMPLLVPTETPSLSAAAVIGFSGLYFAAAVDAAAEDTFPSGIEEVYAIWNYTRMSPTDEIRRIWFRDDQIWLTREEGWNWGEYDSDGTLRDISVYDNEGSGLKPATYRLQLYVNDELQQEATFMVLAP
jgi:hypothetical protein